MDLKEPDWDDEMRKPENLVTIETDEDDITPMDISDVEIDPSDDSDYIPSDEEEHIEQDDQVSKKRKRNTLDTFCIYKITPIHECKALYIGSTTNFKRRLSQHKKNSTNKFKKEFLYKYIRAMGGFDQFKMEKVVEYPCETRAEGLKKEKEFIAGMNANLNSIMLPKEKDINI
jgi:predicted GIY-YIG superfamily endonuclease